MTLLFFVNKFLAISIVLVQVGIVLAVAYLLFFKKKYPTTSTFFGRHGLLIAFLASLIAMSGSLFYSNVAGFTPCELCWFQRIFMYPQVIILFMALWKKDKKIVDYSLALSVIGALIAGYHYLLQIGVASGLPCSAIGYSVSCVKLFVMEFGYITLPLMSFTAFLLIIVSLVFVKIYGNTSKG